MSFYDQHPRLVHDGDFRNVGRCAEDHTYEHWEDTEYCDECEVECAPGGCHSALYVYSDGACSHNGYADAASSIGVYFGPGSKHNHSQALQNTHHTSQRAELQAAIFAIKRAYRVRREIAEDLFFNNYWRGRSRKIVLLTDSVYVFEGIRSWIDRWRENGWTNAKGRDVANRDLWGILANLKDSLAGSLDIIKIPREWNCNADALAKQALWR